MSGSGPAALLSPSVSAAGCLAPPTHGDAQVLLQAIHCVHVWTVQTHPGSEHGVTTPLMVAVPLLSRADEIRAPATVVGWAWHERRHCAGATAAAAPDLVRLL
jgi:hypothetical protein